MKRKGLGSGISALIEDFSTNTENNILFVEVDKVVPNPNQPRKEIKDEPLQELVNSIKTKGIIQPILVQRIKEDSYQIIAGERRWQAANKAKLEKVPVVVKDVSDVEAYELALIENIQRENLNPVEEAQGYRQLIEQFELTQEELSKRLGKSRPVVANSLRILNLPEEVIQCIRNGEISHGHAKVILSLTDKNEQLNFVKEIKEKGLSVFKTSKLKKQIKSKKERKKESKDIFILDVEENLKEFLSASVSIQKKKKGGTLMVNYTNDEHLSNIVEKIIGGGTENEQR
ncbi:MAG: ParB/RepB/Spo0J family partition protein [Nitrospinae bacterium]|nr:ParB/RepB/Spo0J family partition protein [Nitrospinota bacterium]